MAETARPNLFNYATSELSQDAFICWLLSWANPTHAQTDPQLHQCAISLVQALFKRANKTCPDKIEDVTIRKQYKGLDALCEINEKAYVILIEDKTDTRNHSNQLKRYLEIVEKDYHKDNLVPIYYKTGNQDSYKEVEDKGFFPFLREDILEVLSTYSSKSDILIDYKRRMEDLEADTNAYKSVPLKKTEKENGWDFLAWQGFFMELQKDLKGAGWGYVPNPTGGFLGLWWHWGGVAGCETNLVLMYDKLCFRVWVSDASRRKTFRGEYHQKVMEKGKEMGLALSKPKRFGYGEHMTVCEHKGDYRVAKGDGTIDVEKTIDRLRHAEKVFNAVNGVK